MRGQRDQVCLQATCNLDDDIASRTWYNLIRNSEVPVAQLLRDVGEIHSRRTALGLSNGDGIGDRATRRHHLRSRVN